MVLFRQRPTILRRCQDGQVCSECDRLVQLWKQTCQMDEISRSNGAMIPHPAFHVTFIQGQRLQFASLRETETLLHERSLRRFFVHPHVCSLSSVRDHHTRYLPSLTTSVPCLLGHYKRQPPPELPIGLTVTSTSREARCNSSFNSSSRAIQRRSIFLPECFGRPSRRIDWLQGRSLVVVRIEECGIPNQHRMLLAREPRILPEIANRISDFCFATAIVDLVAPEWGPPSLPFLWSIGSSFRSPSRGPTSIVCKAGQSTRSSRQLCALLLSNLFGLRVVN